MSPWAASARSAKASHACAAPATNARPPSQRRGTISCRCCRVASIRFYSPAAYFPTLSSPAAVPSRNRQSAQARGIAGARRRLICFAPLCFAHVDRSRCGAPRSSEETRPGRSISCSRPIRSMSATFVHPDGISSDQLKHLCLIVHAGYGSFDLAGRCVALSEQRKELRAGALQQYVEMLRRLERQIRIGARLTRECPGRAERGLLRERNETRAPALAREGRALGRDTRPRSNAVLLRCTKMRAGMHSGHFLAPAAPRVKWPVCSSRWHCRRGAATISLAANR